METKINTKIIDFNKISKRIKHKRKEKYNYKFNQEFYIWLAQNIREYLNYAFQNIQSEEQLKYFCCRMIESLKTIGYDGIENDIPDKFKI
jgi:hypothetical protein